MYHIPRRHAFTLLRLLYPFSAAGRTMCGSVVRIASAQLDYAAAQHIALYERSARGR